MTDKAPALRPEWVASPRTALLLIDCQVDFGAPEGEMAKHGADIAPAQAALAKAETLADAARGAGVEIVFVRLLNRPGAQSAVMREARQRRGDDGLDVCIEGTHGAEFCGPRPRPGDMIVSKPRFSAFAATALAGQLRAKGIDTLVLAGLTTECCVAASAWDAFERDFHVFIARDACAAYAPDLHDGALKALELSGAILAKTMACVAAWKSE